MRQVDDAHDAEDQVEPEPHQAEIKPEQQPGEDRVGQHGLKLEHRRRGCIRTVRPSTGALRAPAQDEAPFLVASTLDALLAFSSSLTRPPTRSTLFPYTTHSEKRDRAL